MQSFSQRILAWFEHHGRKHLPWQQNPTLYTTWISEIMLQQTQVATVIPYYQRFIARFPNVGELAKADLDEVLALWAGLGYYSRARNLHKAAQMIRNHHRGHFPHQLPHVLALPGIGQSTAGAILSLSLNQSHAILDGNVKRVLSRHQLIDGIPNRSDTLKKQWAAAKRFMPTKNAAKYTQAMMDVGAMICTRSTPRCQQCPVYVDCGAYLQDKTAEYPNKKPKKTLPEKHIAMLIIKDEQRVYLYKRPNKGIWGGLWSLPEISCDRAGVVEQSEIQGFTQSLGLNVGYQQVLANYRHTFTHYRLHILPILLHVESLTDGFTPAQLQNMGLPTPVRHILTSCEPSNPHVAAWQNT